MNHCEWMAERLGFGDRVDRYVDFAQSCDLRALAAPALHLGGEERLRSWVVRGMPAATPDDVEIIGDDDVVDATLAVLGAMPMPHLEHVARRVVVFGVTDVNGCCIYGPRIPAPDDDQLHVVVVIEREGDLAGTIAHELGHSWVRPMTTTPPEPAAKWRRRMRDLAFRAVELERRAPDAGLVDKFLLGPVLRGERAADAIGSLWLGRPVRCGDDGIVRPQLERALIGRSAAAGASVPGAAEELERDLAEDSEGDEP